jgi:hypothetical protein
MLQSPNVRNRTRRTIGYNLCLSLLNFRGQLAHCDEMNAFLPIPQRTVNMSVTSCQ